MPVQSVYLSTVTCRSAVERHIASPSISCSSLCLVTFHCLLPSSFRPTYLSSRTAPDSKVRQSTLLRLARAYGTNIIHITTYRNHSAGMMPSLFIAGTICSPLAVNEAGQGTSSTSQRTLHTSTLPREKNRL